MQIKLTRRGPLGRSFRPSFRHLDAVDSVNRDGYALGRKMTVVTRQTFNNDLIMYSLFLVLLQCDNVQLIVLLGGSGRRGRFTWTAVVSDGTN